jgi:beta-glucosidase
LQDKADHWGRKEQMINIQRSDLKMNKILFLLCVMFQMTSFSVSAQESKMVEFINNLMAKMIVEEKVGQLNLSTATNLAQAGPSANRDVEEKIRAGNAHRVI